MKNDLRACEEENAELKSEEKHLKDEIELCIVARFSFFSYISPSADLTWRIPHFLQCK